MRTSSQDSHGSNEDVNVHLPYHLYVWNLEQSYFASAGLNSSQ